MLQENDIFGGDILALVPHCSNSAYKRKVYHMLLDSDEILENHFRYSMIFRTLFSATKKPLKK